MGAVSASRAPLSPTTSTTEGFVLAWLVALLTLGGAPNASANGIYSYTGNTFDEISDETPPAGSFTTSMRMSAQFEVAVPLAPDLRLTDITGSVLGYTINDGRNTLTPLNALLNILVVETNSLGNIVLWLMEVGTPFDGRGLFMSTTIQPAFSDDFSNIAECVTEICDFEDINRDSAHVRGNPGTWTLIPEPTTGLLLASGLLALGAVKRGKR